MVFQSVDAIRASANYEAQYPDATIAELVDGIVALDPMAIPQDASPEQLLSFFDVLMRTWGDSPEDMSERQTLLYGPGPVTDMTLRQKQYMLVAMRIKVLIQQYDDDVVDEPTQNTLLNMLDTFTVRVHLAYVGAVAHLGWAAENAGEAHSMLRQSRLTAITDQSRPGRTHTQQMEDEFLRLMAQHRLRKAEKIDPEDKDPMLYMPVYRRSENGDYVYVHAYTEYMTMEEFIYEMFEVNPELRDRTTKERGTVFSIINHCKKTKSQLLPKIKVKRTQVSDPQIRAINRSLTFALANHSLSSGRSPTACTMRRTAWRTTMSRKVTSAAQTSWTTRKSRCTTWTSSLTRPGTSTRPPTRTAT